MGLAQSGQTVRLMLARTKPSRVDHDWPERSQSGIVAGYQDGMVARLQAASSSGKPVLLRVEAQDGHTMSSTRLQINAELADKLVFLLEQFGQ